LYGLEEDLGMAGNQYQTAVSLLFVTYILSELPSNLVIKRFRPSRWIAFITTSWGIIATCTGAVQSYGGLIVCRLLLGAVEGGLFPGCVLYLTLFYTKRELALRVGYLFVSAALAGGLGGLLGYAIGKLDHHAGLRAWRWIMIIEGLPTFVLGIAVWWWLADDPETAYYLTPAEKELVIVRKERQIGYSRSADELHKEDVIKGLKDWKVYVICVGQFCMDTMLYGYSTVSILHTLHLFAALTAFDVQPKTTCVAYYFQASMLPCCTYLRLFFKKSRPLPCCRSIFLPHS
jgi:MFS family permease